MRFPIVAVLFAALAAGATADSLDSAVRARELLGPGVWSRVLRIENSDPDHRYGRRLHALVFELEGLLWFYTDADGTQSFSQHRGRLEEEKRETGRLLRGIHPGFDRFEDITNQVGLGALTGPTEAGALPNGCFIESVAYFLARCSEGSPVEDARLLAYYFKDRGHTVLLFRDEAGTWVYDAYERRRPWLVPAFADDRPITAARAVTSFARWGRPERAVFLELAAERTDCSRRAPGRSVASSATPTDNLSQFKRSGAGR